MKTTLCTAVLLGAFANAQPAETQLANSAAVLSRENRWQEDLDYFARELPARHLDFFKLVSKGKFEREVRTLARALPNMSDVEVVFRLMRLGASAGVAHTWVGFPPKAPVFHGYPFILHWFGDELAVVAATPEHRQLLAARVLKIGSKTPKQAVAAVAPYISYENKIWLSAQSPLLLRNAELLQLLKITQPDGHLRLSLVRPDGERLALDIAPAAQADPLPWVTAWDALSIPPVLHRKRRDPYWYEYLPDNRALYIQYNQCRDVPEHPFASFVREVLALADSNAVERVVVDLRFNGGGSSSVIRPLVTGLKSRAHLRGKDHLLVLIGPNTFSSGVHAAVELRGDPGATLVGQPTGGKPNSYGESPHFRLPHSQMEVHYCTKNFRLIRNANPPSLMPDVRVTPSLKDFLAGRDPELEAALGLRGK